MIAGMAGSNAVKPIVVIGSINMDLVCRIGQLPRSGETILGSDLQAIAGGKGANQAVAASRLGADVYQIGRVGSDDFGQQLIAGLKQNKVNTKYVKVTPKTSSGCALILVDENGENSIVVSPGANAHIHPTDIDAAQGLIRRSACVVMQLEIPLKTIQYAIKLCRRLGVYTILDPAPAPKHGLPRELFKVDLISPNETEAQILLGRKTLVEKHRNWQGRAIAAGNQLRQHGAGAAVLKLGAKGAMLVGESTLYTPGFKVRVVDTTAAGDSFTAALAVARAQGMSLPESLRMANAAGALACTTLGAQPSLPTSKAVQQLLNKHRRRG